MTYYIVLSPYSGKWLRAPFDGASLNRNEAHPYPADHPYLDNMVRMARRHGFKLRLRQVMVATCEHGNRGPCLTCGNS